MAADPPPTPPRAEDLLAVLRRADDGVAGREHVLRTLLGSTITVALHEQSLLIARTRDGTRIALAFTDGEALRAWAGDQEVAWGGIAGSDLVRHLLTLPAVVELVVNVAGPNLLHVNREELERLADDALVAPPDRPHGVPRREVHDPTDVELLTAAAPLPAAVTGAIAAALPALDGAIAVYALELRAGEDRRPALGVHLAPDADAAPVAAGLQAALEQVLEPGDVLDLVPLRAEHLDALREGGHPPLWSRDDF